MSLSNKLKIFTYYISNDTYWLLRRFIKPFHDFFIVRKLIKTFYKNKIDKILDLRLEDRININDIEKQENDTKVFDPVTNVTKKYLPEILDLSRLYSLIKDNKPFTVLEFGVGYSSIVIAQALYENKKIFSKNNEILIRNSKMFKLFCVDKSQKWIDETQKNIPEHLKEFIEIIQSDVEIRDIDNQICHVYKKIPDINPEFIYLDGPHPLDPVGNVNNISFQCLERTPISADILLLESTLLPGTRILVDGRTNNVRFLKNNLKRKFKFKWDRFGDVTHIILAEKKLGKLNKLGYEFY